MLESPDVHFFLKEIAIPSECSHLLADQHLSFEVSNLNEIVENLKAHGITKFETGHFSHFRYRNYRWIEWRDPDGIRLECIQRL